MTFDGWWLMADGWWLMTVMTLLLTHMVPMIFFLFLFFDIRYSVLFHCNGYRYLSNQWSTHRQGYMIARWAKIRTKIETLPKANTKFNQIFSINFSVWRQLVNIIAFVIRYFMFFYYSFFNVYDWNMLWGYANSTIIIIL